MTWTEKVNKHAEPDPNGRPRWRWVLDRKAESGINPERVSHDVLRLATQALEGLDRQRPTGEPEHHLQTGLAALMRLCGYDNPDRARLVHELEELALHRQFIQDICDTLVEVGPWTEIDGDGTEGSVISGHITQLADTLARAIGLLRETMGSITSAAGHDAWLDINRFLVEYDERRETVPEGYTSTADFEQDMAARDPRAT